MSYRGQVSSAKVLYKAHSQSSTQVQRKSMTYDRNSPTLTPSLHDRTLLLPDGRTLGYAEYGNAQGVPLVCFHGFPTSRLADASGMHSMAFGLNIRLLSLDRPGFGLSTHDPRRRITDWPADVQEFAAQVGLERFAVLGVSGGGPYALACARLLPKDRLTAVGVLAGAPVWDNGVRTEGVPWYSRLCYLAANYWPSGLRVMSDCFVVVVRWLMTTNPVEKRIDAWLEALTRAKAAKEDKKDVEKVPLTAETHPDESQVTPSTAQRRRRLMSLIFEGFAQGSAGFVHEARLLTRPWGFDFEDITYDTVYMWHGSKDANAPVRSIRIMADRMPHCVLKEVDNNHFGMGTYIEEVLGTLTEQHTNKTGADESTKVM